MSPRPGQTAIDQRTHIPAHVEQAMAQQMQRGMPAHLQKYVGSDRPAYVPQHIEKQLAQHMQKNLPGHLKQYAGAYMQQQVIQPNRISTGGVRPTGNSFSAPRTPDVLKRDHSISNASQYTVKVDPSAVSTQPETLLPQQIVQPTVAQPAQPTPQQPPYDFIMNPEQPAPKSRLSLPGGGGGASSILIRTLLISGLLLVLLIGFSFIKGLVTGGSNLPAFVGVAQDQQAMIHLVTAADQQQDLSVGNKNFAATARLSLTSAQSELISYLSTNGKKVDAKQLSLKISAATDERLETAAAATTYNETFQEIMKDKLTEYISHLQQTYDQTKGKKGQALLSNDYDQAQLLLTQLEQASGQN